MPFKQQHNADFGPWGCASPLYWGFCNGLFCVLLVFSFNWWIFFASPILFMVCEFRLLLLFSFPDNVIFSPFSLLFLFVPSFREYLICYIYFDICNSKLFIIVTYFPLLFEITLFISGKEKLLHRLALKLVMLLNHLKGAINFSQEY